MKCTPRGPDSELEMLCLLRVSAKASGPQRKTPILVLWGKKERKRQFQALGCHRLNSSTGISKWFQAPGHNPLCSSFVLSTNGWVQMALSESCSALFVKAAGYFKWKLTSLENDIQVGFMEISTTEKMVVNLWVVGYLPPGLCVLPTLSSILKSGANPV